MLAIITYVTYHRVPGYDNITQYMLRKENEHRLAMGCVAQTAEKRCSFLIPRTGITRCQSRKELMVLLLSGFGPNVGLLVATAGWRGPIVLLVQFGPAANSSSLPRNSKESPPNKLLDRQAQTSQHRPQRRKSIGSQTITFWREV